MNNKGKPSQATGKRGPGGQASGGKRNSRYRTASGGAGSATAAAAVNAPVNKNEEYTIDIVGLTHDGEGVGRANNFTLFVHGALPGEQVLVKVLKVKKQYGYAKLMKLLQTSPDRVNAPCTIYKQCGGCQLQHMSYEAQLRWKRQHVVDNLTRIGKLNVDGDIIVHPTIGMDEPWRYRNKAQVPIGMALADIEDGAAGGLIGGFYAQGSHRIIDMDACLIQHERNDEVVRQIKRIGTDLGITAYDEESGRGLLRHVVVRTGFVTGELMVVLVTNGSHIPNKSEWIAGIRAAMPDVNSIVQNVNTRDTNVIFGDETRTLWGSDVIYDELDGIRFAISARSFYQVNPSQTVALYRKAVDYAGLTGAETVIDAYCGIGTISLFLARKAGRVYGVEVVPEAIEDAKRNAELNGIANAEFEAGLSEVVIPRWREEGIAADVIVVDPPRKGCDAALLDTIIRMKPERVVYVSCNPSTLARDLRVLEDGGYRTVEVTPVDMFPHTVHVECVVGLVRKGK
ncbi:23S rRNA (uracil(1939)-C(5))-methyltransferase RlmD [Paenibacillus sp. MMS18-CY102]|uniref:23S rRNA (uracil(1939)-C(5))-methyltransferase RlmD n=1 Tax=Paenibacillus sp. MMS18-CY102 TaxID=2682849 RepID=UPI0013663453|nr:23S rRNA (uracil(1939)-C(5))-methyltransferase RlmD [Paenibacillus sp. MMS18-CY102]MWC31089.1 23S rRNA (uracil(1939)-C(5))-methyltransferase RlmD [Paenibacillus sp. MMS18-CY102]